MNKTLNLFILFLFISNCSLDTKTGLWSKTEKLKTENKVKEKKYLKKKKFMKKNLTNN